MAGKYLKRQLKKAGRTIAAPFKAIAKIPWYLRRAYDRRAIKDRSFTIISNNCWAGKVYQYLDMPYLSPTVGLYFFADDYIRFVSDLRRYLSTELEFISVEESKHAGILREQKQERVPIGKLDDVELIFLHYKSREEAREKWDRRKARVNYDDLILKFSRMNGCTEEHMAAFSAIPYERKILLNDRKVPLYKCEKYWKDNKLTGGAFMDTDPFPGSIDLIKILSF